MSAGDVTRLLVDAGGGDRAAFERLYESVYGELRRLAQAQMRREGLAATLQPTALVNEACLRLLPAAPERWENRRHFFGAAAEAMRRILVEHARQRLAQKRGAGAERVTLSGLDLVAPDAESDVLDVDAALTALAAQRPRLAELVQLRFFAGLSIEDAARALDVSVATAKRDWLYARTWLLERMQAEHPS